MTTDKQQVIAALLETPTIAEAAAGVGLSPRTIFRMLENPGFRRAYAKARNHVFAHNCARVQAMTGLALDALRAVVLDKEAPATAIVAAARVLLDFGGLSARQDLSERVAAIEAALKRRQRNSR